LAGDSGVLSVSGIIAIALDGGSASLFHFGMVSKFHKRFAIGPHRLAGFVLVGAVCIAVAGCATGSDATSSTGNILLSKAEERASLASRSLDEATSMIAEGRQQRADGQRAINEGEEKIRVGEKLKASAETELRRAEAQVASERRHAGLSSSGEVTMIPLERP
jgi:hypothetical protein